MPIISPFAPNPFVDGRQSDNAMLIRRGVEAHLHDLNYATLAELTLKSGRRADLIALSPKGEIIIVEIKSSVEDFRVDTKWPDYREFCDQFYFATHSDVPLDIFPPQEGLILADGFGAEIIREADVEKMSAPARKALTLRFARASAGHLSRLLSHRPSE